MTNYHIFEVSNGWIALVGRKGVLTRSTLPQKTRDAAFALIEAGLDADSIENHNNFDVVSSRLTRYFEGIKTDFSDIAIDLGKPGQFIMAVQNVARKIPYGTLVTYGELARMAGRAKAARAAGSAMAKNPVPVIVPCHRVVAAGGAIGGFGPGLEWKRTLLRLEGVDI